MNWGDVLEQGVVDVLALLAQRADRARQVDGVVD